MIYFGNYNSYANLFLYRLCCYYCWSAVLTAQNQLCCQKPPDDYARVEVNGWTIHQRTLVTEIKKSRNEWKLCCNRFCLFLLP